MGTFDDSAILFLSPNQHELEIIQDAIKPRRVLIADDVETALSIIQDVKTIGIVLVDVSSSSLIQIISSVKDSSGPFPIRVIGLADEEMTLSNALILSVQGILRRPLRSADIIRVFGVQHLEPVDRFDR